MIRLDKVSVAYRRRTRREIFALRDCDLTARPGMILGIAGTNGAGKSTLLNLLLGFLDPTAGTVSINNMPARRYVAQNGASYLPEPFTAPPKWSVRETIQRYGSLSGHPTPDVTARADHLVAMWGLEPYARSSTLTLSKGTLQRLGLAVAFFTVRRLVVLDEPMDGLDPVWLQAFRDHIAKLRAPNRLVILASHNLAEIEKLADEVVILHEGSVRHVFIRDDDRPADAFTLLVSGLDPTRILNDLQLVFHHQPPDRFVVQCDVRDLNRCVARIINDGGLIQAMCPRRQSLEEEFRTAIRDD